MHQQHFTYDPHLPGFAYGFYDLFKNNQRAIIHDGNGNGFTSGLFLLPDKNLGFFVAYTNDEFMPRQKLVDEFFDHYYPAQRAPAPAPPADFQPGRYSGSYTIYRYD